jgi:hypothetical protein
MLFQSEAPPSYTRGPSRNGNWCDMQAKTVRKEQMQGGESRSYGEEHAADRLCLGGCNRMFWSEGPWNRSCPKCAEKNLKLSRREASRGSSPRCESAVLLQAELIDDR